MFNVLNNLLLYHEIVQEILYGLLVVDVCVIVYVRELYGWQKLVVIKSHI